MNDQRAGVEVAGGQRLAGVGDRQRVLGRRVGLEVAGPEGGGVMHDRNDVGAQERLPSDVADRPLTEDLRAARELLTETS